MILHWHQKLSHSQRATLSIKKLSQARLDANKKTSREAKTTCNRPSWNAAQGSRSCNSQLSRERAEHSRNKAGKKGLILHWQQKLSHSQTKTLHNPSILKKQVMKGQPSSCNSQPTRVKFEIPEHDRSWAGKKKIKSTAASRYCYNSHFHEFWWITWFSFFFF